MGTGGAEGGGGAEQEGEGRTPFISTFVCGSFNTVLDLAIHVCAKKTP